ncbi:MAG: PA2779 family protein [Pseudomonadales bacterium]|uniref:PA2779 family protein n=1 Tax=Oleiphilus messinensis TaxID=141451 RepID=A0A1Y0I240_9GAMM|nr:PA2779 family protein [Oleiphilus messinensis]ARU54532.1 hypothetical protein OLMES_0428 [Oleiphilus messinensis]MCG8610245.1 PA2779 family protein [Pseudomonadales bacterium]
MPRLQELKRYIALITSFAIFFLGLQSSVVRAAMVSTESQLVQVQQQVDLKEIQETVASDEARKLLSDWGLSPEQVDQRVAKMTPAEVAEFNAKLNDMPAGGTSVIGVVLFIFLVLIVLDLLGTTNIFPVIKPIDQY